MHEPQVLDLAERDPIFLELEVLSLRLLDTGEVLRVVSAPPSWVPTVVVTIFVGA
jgi:hypothetical protein